MNKVKVWKSQSIELKLEDNYVIISKNDSEIKIEKGELIGIYVIIQEIIGELKKGYR